MEHKERSFIMEKLFKNFKKRPVAFIGSGISKRYMNTPTWEQLLNKVIMEYDTNTSHFGHLMLNNNHDMEMVASIIEKEYTDYFYKMVTTNSNHKDYPLYIKYKSQLDLGKISPFKILISNYFLRVSTNETFEKEKDLFINMLNKCSNVITTNYDTLIEDNSSFKKVVGSKSFINDQCIGFGEVYKIHGCCTQPDSIVIKKKDYEKFNNKQSFYHAKLLLSFVEKPIIFLGYSISDNYIKKILESVSDNLDESEINNLANRLVFIEYDETALKPEKYIKQISNINMTCIKLKDFSYIYKIIGDNIKIGIPLELVRMFQEAVKNFVYEQDNPRALSVKGIDEIDDIHNLTAFHIGKPELKSDRKDIIKPEDLILDVLFNNLNMSADEVLKIVMRETSIFPRSSYTPLYRYVKNNATYKINFLTKKYFKSLDDMYSKCEVIDFRVLDSEDEVIKAINNTNKMYEKLSYLQSNLKKISSASLRKILIDIYNSFPEELESSNNKSVFRKLVCMLDYLENL